MKSLSLNSRTCKLSWEIGSVFPSRRLLEVKLFDEDNEIVVPIFLDERDNTIQIPENFHKHSVMIYLYEKFLELKSSDFRYQKDSGFEGKTLFLEEFINFLLQEERDSQITKIIN